MEEKQEKALPIRKSLRNPRFDYNATGVYFVTICTEDREQILSRIVGDGASTSRTSFAKTELTHIGEIVEKYINSSTKMKNVIILNYVIMPNHIHILVFIDSRGLPRDVEAPSPTDRQNQIIPRFVSALKRFCNKEIGYNIFQRSYFDHIIRNDRDLDEHINYILENPKNWQLDELYSEK